LLSLSIINISFLIHAIPQNFSSKMKKTTGSNTRQPTASMFNSKKGIHILRINRKKTEHALEKAAKMICTMKLGACPLQEDNFSGCVSNCHADVLPWQCWVAHLVNISEK
jgi:hypothetical protein